MFIYDKRQGGVTVRRLEHKMGIIGSPTCELVFKDAPGELVGDRKLGLIKYVMALMNGARLGIHAQSVGVSESAYREALAYAKERMQFGKAIITLPRSLRNDYHYESKIGCIAYFIVRNSPFC